ncbi:hypothetical protein [Undibacterium sp. CCC3.4]|nr:hypothetical protein [Undibacterium sp. CCC3.4]
MQNSDRYVRSIVVSALFALLVCCCAASKAQTVTKGIDAQVNNGKVVLNSTYFPGGRFSLPDLRFEKYFDLRKSSQFANGQTVPPEIRRKSYMYHAINPGWKTISVSNGR